jgi:hypothetical protein
MAPLVLPSTLDGVSDELHFPGKELPVPIQRESGLAPEAVLTFRRREQSLVPVWNRNQNGPARSLVTIRTTGELSIINNKGMSVCRREVRLLVEAARLSRIWKNGRSRGSYTVSQEGIHNMEDVPQNETSIAVPPRLTHTLYIFRFQTADTTNHRRSQLATSRNVVVADVQRQDLEDQSKIGKSA